MAVTVNSGETLPGAATLPPEVVSGLPSPRRFPWRASGLRHGISRDTAIMTTFVLLVIVVLVWSVFPPYSTTVPSGIPFVGPSGSHWAGTDAVGLDIFSRALVGARLSLIAAGAVIGSGIAIGSIVGTIAGYAGGVVDTVLMRITDVFLALPAPVLAIAVAGAFGRSFGVTLVSVAVVWWPLYARVVRGEVRSLLARPHVDAARLAGGGRSTLLVRHVLPGSLPPVLVAASLDVGLVVLTLASLSFLGLGSPEPAPELGSMAAQGLPNLLTAWWMPVMPSVMVFLIAYGANLCGDALRDFVQQRQVGQR